jgi:enoyl-[acyl-carrier protein] reductase II
MPSMTRDQPNAVLRTVLCERLGLDYPICQAGMGWIARDALAAAVSAAGGLGVIGAEGYTPDELRAAIRRVRAAVGERPFGVDILFGAVKSARSAGVDAYEGNVVRQIEVALDERVPVLVSGLGSPQAILDEAHARGITVMSVIGNVRHARRLAAAGVDFLIAQGHEAGGHTGRIGTFTLVPQVVDAVDVPVLAAGGIGDGRGLVAALALGACGVWLGTRFVASVEAYAHLAYKERIVATDEEGTVVTRAHSGKPCRLIRNRFTDAWDAQPQDIQPFPAQFVEVGREAARRARLEGAVEEGGLPAGQVSGMIRAVEPAGEIVRRIVEEARTVLGRWVAAP